MTKIMAALVRENNLTHGVYAEPFAGGCGLALNLLFGGHVSEIHVNDIDPAIWSFWHSVLHHTDELIEKIEAVEVTMEEWRCQKEVFKASHHKDPVSLGFSAFFLNRTNRSGIIQGAGVIGGVEQKGNYKIDCRFNKSDLIAKIKRIAKYGNRIHLTRMDAVEFIPHLNDRIPDRSLVCIDPPYFNKGSSLYTSFYRPEDHRELAAAIQQLTKPWVVTYDNVDEINALYDDQRRYGFDVNYSVQTKRVATELFVASDELVVPLEIEERQLA